MLGEKETNVSGTKAGSADKTTVRLGFHSALLGVGRSMERKTGLVVRYYFTVLSSKRAEKNSMVS